MISSFVDDTSRDIYNSQDTKAARRIPKEVWPSARRKLTLLHNAANTLELAKNLGLQFKPLKHDRPGFNSIRVNDIYRVIFKFENGNASEVGIENYHGKHTT